MERWADVADVGPTYYLMRWLGLGALPSHRGRGDKLDELRRCRPWRASTVICSWRVRAGSEPRSWGG